MRRCLARNMQSLVLNQSSRVSDPRLSKVGDVMSPFAINTCIQFFSFYIDMHIQ